MRSLTDSELQMIENALEMKILIYECYSTPKRQEELQRYRLLLAKVRSTQKFRSYR
ncbi:hypothetical protein [Chryseobacterium sp.]|uniref:hypothetical protein n=1 Tax=Chryseobacterium sp. TaxID=1871047 RepID=UPI0031CE4859